MTDRGRLSVGFIAVGSNIEPCHNIVSALGALVLKTEVTASSTFYRTVPIGRSNQPMFINGVWLICTHLSPVQIRDELLRPIENQLGRRRTADKCAPRTIDLDLILYDDWVRDDTEVTLPHPDVNRPFVCGPILEILDRHWTLAEHELRERMTALLPAPETVVSPGEVESELSRKLWHLIERKTSLPSQ